MQWQDEQEEEEEEEEEEDIARVEHILSLESKARDCCTTWSATLEREEMVIVRRARENRDVRGVV